MCGLAGIYHTNSQLELEHLVRFSDPIKHRGPDYTGYFIDNKEAFGMAHHRLSIIDLDAASNQPFHYLDKYVVTFNGAIYNYIELKKTLETKGYSFRTTGDTEVIAAAYDFYGEDCSRHFNGMWAIAIWNKDEQELFLSRDRYGIKPLFYLKNSEQFAFASETVAFKSLQNYSREFDENNLIQSLYNSEALEGSGVTIFREIEQLKAGHFALYKNGELTINQWYQIENGSKSYDSNYQNQCDKFLDILTDSCKIRLRSDVDIATSLSGGLDSSSIFAMVNKVKKNHGTSEDTRSWNNTFTLSFPNTERDELQFASIMSSKFNSNHHIINANTISVEEIIDYTKYFDSVFHNPNYILFLLYKAYSENNVKVALEGHGVDELFFGYPHMIRELCDIDSASLDQLSQSDLFKLYYSITGIRINGKKVSNLAKLKRVVRKLIRNQQVNKKPPNNSWYYNKEKLNSSQKAEEPIDIIKKSFFDTTLPSVLRNFDRASMHYAVETRMPFMDYRLVEYAYHLPLSSKIDAAYNKRILRDAMANILPDEIRLRSDKKGLIAPMSELMSEQLKDYIMDMFHSDSFKQSPYWNAAEIQSFVLNKYRNNSFSFYDGFKLWPVINAYMLINE